MQIHELTKPQLNEVDIVGAGGILSKIGTAAKAIAGGGAKDAIRTVIPGQGQGAFSTHDLTQSDFAKRMQAVKNNAAIKQVAVNLQKQWMQTSKTLPAATTPSPGTTTSAPGYSSVKTNAPAGIPNVGKSNLPTPTQAPQPTKTAPATPASTSTAAGTYDKKTGAATMGGKPMIAAKDLPPHIQKQIGAVTETSTQSITEATSLGQLTDWYKKSVIPPSMAAYSAKYLENSVIKTALNRIIAVADNAGEQEKAFEDLVAATSVVSQEITAQAPAATRGAPTPTAPRSLSGGAALAKTEIGSSAGISPAQIEALAKTAEIELKRVIDTEEEDHLDLQDLQDLQVLLRLKLRLKKRLELRPKLRLRQWWHRRQHAEWREEHVVLQRELSGRQFAGLDMVFGILDDALACCAGIQVLGEQSLITIH
jgi:hypothetical protein